MRRERFLEELETYNRQVDELEELGELVDLPRYLRRAQGLEEKLQQALDRAAAINDEEEAFEWDVTNYPRRKEVRGRAALGRREELRSRVGFRSETC